MTKPIAVVMADSHLTTSTLAEGRLKDDGFFSLHQAIDLAIRLNVGVIGAGDLLDDDVNVSKTVEVMVTELGRLKAAGLPMWFIQGQHEMGPGELSGIPWFGIGGLAQHVDRKCFSIAGHRFYGLDFRHREPLLKELERFTVIGTDVLIMHQVWGDWMLDEANPQADFVEVPQVPLLLTGDYHKRVEMWYPSEDSLPRMKIVSTGSMCAQKIDEDWDKYVAILNDDLSITWHQLKVRPRLQDVVVKDEDQLAQLADRFNVIYQKTMDEAGDLSSYPESVRRPVWRVICDPSVADVERRVSRWCRNHVHLYVKLLGASRGKVDDQHIKPLVTELPTLESKAASHFSGNPEAAALAQRLLSTTQPLEVEIAAWLDETPAGGAT